MPLTKSADAVAAKWARVTPERTQDYEDGVRNPVKDWGTQTVASEETYKAGVTAAIGRGAFGKGVRKAGTGKWQKGAIEKGTSRFGPGVQAAKPEYQTAIADVLSTINSVTLPPRYPKGDARNYARSQAIGNALHKKAIGG